VDGAPASPVLAGRAVTVMLAEAVYLHDHVLAQVAAAGPARSGGGASRTVAAISRALSV
jgi:hypothetical protein